MPKLNWDENMHSPDPPRSSELQPKQTEVLDVLAMVQQPEP